MGDGMSHVLVDRGVALVEYVTLWSLEELCEAWREGRGKLGVAPESYTLGGHPNGCLSPNTGRASILPHLRLGHGVPAFPLLYQHCLVTQNPNMRVRSPTNSAWLHLRSMLKVLGECMALWGEPS